MMPVSGPNELIKLNAGQALMPLVGRRPHLVRSSEHSAGFVSSRPIARTKAGSLGGCSPQKERSHAPHLESLFDAGVAAILQAQARALELDFRFDKATIGAS
jgi:hypothetical protein